MSPVPGRPAGRILDRPAGRAGLVAASYVLGSVPVTNIVARRWHGVDLRTVGTGTVSGTGLYSVAGFGPLAGAGGLELAKGALGPRTAGPARPGLARACVAAAIAGHNWSPFLRGRGGRGQSVALGALLALAPEGTALIAAGMAGGRVVHRTGLASLLALVGLPVLLGRTRGRDGAALGLCVTVPIVAKRLTGDHRPPRPWPTTAVARLLFDRDTRTDPGRRT